MAENATQRKEEDKRKKAEIHQLCKRICRGKDKSKLSPHQSKIPQECILGDVDRRTATGRCQAGNDIRAAIAVYLRGDQAAA